jgi:hypothetical protein
VLRRNSLKKLIARPDVHNITFPKFCTLYVSLPILRLKQKELSLAAAHAPGTKSLFSEELLATEHKIKSLEEQDARWKKRQNMGWQTYQVNNYVPLLMSKLYTKNKTRFELEEFQNEEI